MHKLDNMKSDKMSWKPLKDQIQWQLEANRLFRETHQRIGRLEENRLLFYLLKLCTIETDHPYTRLSVKEIGMLPDLPGETEAVKELLRRLRGYCFWVRAAETSESHNETLTSWIDHVIFDPAGQQFIVMLSPFLYPYIICLHQRFQTMATVSLPAHVLLKSKYSNRLFELLRVHETVQELPLTLAQLRYLMDVDEGKLERWVDLKRRVIEPAVEEVNQTKFFHVTYEPIKEGRSVARVRFCISRA